MYIVRVERVVICEPKSKVNVWYFGSLGTLLDARFLRNHEVLYIIERIAVKPTSYAGNAYILYHLIIWTKKTDILI
jgi:hypothetical protein